MPSLRDLRDRIGSVKSTKKITSAMKMVAASKLRRAQDRAEASQPYATAMGQMLARVAANVTISPASPKLLIGTGKEETYLLVLITADRGLCGGFNANVIRQAREQIQSLRGAGKTIKIVCVGRKGYDALKRDYSSLILKRFTDITGKPFGFAEADQVTQFILETFAAGDFDICTLIGNEFQSILTQKPYAKQIVPFRLTEVLDGDDNEEDKAEGLISPYEFEPEEDLILGQLLPKNIGVQVYSALLDSAAGEQAARMTAMDNATSNASDMINKLTLQYNRARQAYITKELIEIISGAEAL